MTGQALTASQVVFHAYRQSNIPLKCVVVVLLIFLFLIRLPAPGLRLPASFSSSSGFRIPASGFRIPDSGFRLVYSGILGYGFNWLIYKLNSLSQKWHCIKDFDDMNVVVWQWKSTICTGLPVMSSWTYFNWIHSKTKSWLRLLYVANDFFHIPVLWYCNWSHFTYIANLLSG